MNFKSKLQSTHNGRKWTLVCGSSTSDASDSIWRCRWGTRPNLLRKMGERIGLASRELRRLQPFRRVRPTRRHQRCMCRQSEPYKQFRICGTLSPILQWHVCVRQYADKCLRRLFHWPKHLWFLFASTSQRIYRWHRSLWFSYPNKRNIYEFDINDFSANTHLSAVNGVNTGHIKPLK